MSRRADGVTKYEVKGRAKGVLYTLLGIQIITAVVLLVTLLTSIMLPAKYIVAGIITEIILVLFTCYMRKNRILCVISGVLSVVIIAIHCIGIYYVYKTNNALDKITNHNVELTNTIDVYVLKGDKAATIKDAADYSYVVAKGQDSEDHTKAIEHINKKAGKTINIADHLVFTEAIDSLYNKECKAIIIDRAYVDILDGIEEYKDFNKKTKCIYSYDVRYEEITEIETTAKKEDKKKKIDITKDNFNVYISGIDVEGSVSAKSRSDVNIIASVNPKTHQIFLLSTPRDYYVPLSISGGSRDKLTHAGLYGVDVSRQTLEMLYDTKIQYSIRMNFTGFRNIINALGGVDVYSEYNFSSKGHYYKEGYNSLDGEAALWFARERHAFSNGDNQRGKNQMEVIKAVFKKVQSPSILNNYNSLLDSVADCMETSFTSEEISKFVNFQTENNIEWDVVNYSVTGFGSSQTTYTVPGKRAYVMSPDMNTVAEAKKMLKDMASDKKIEK
ncbi:MAG: LCP family protein [Lachnospiraceae bacterium]|nr:LCP family protein [Lachnospiraceae bacterium]